MPELYDKECFGIGYNDNQMEVMVISIPLKRLADDFDNGTALLRGKVDEIKQIALSEIKRLRARKVATEGIIRVPGAAVVKGNGKEPPELHVA
jgi:hypothetical protein